MSSCFETFIPVMNGNLYIIVGNKMKNPYENIGCSGMGPSSMAGRREH